MTARSDPPARGVRSRKAAALVVALLCLAPVPGDIGACGQPVQRLDADVFFRAKRHIDCDRCGSCGIASTACRDACDRATPGLRAFPAGCEPLVHDGEVCLRRLRDAACSEYAEYQSDDHPSVPSECDFCPEEKR